MTKSELLESISWEWDGGIRCYIVKMAGDPVFFTDDTFQRCLFIAALKAQVLLQSREPSS